MVLAAASMLAGCHEPVLTSRPEDEANTALATLARAGVQARKLDVGRGSFSVVVPPSRLEQALEVLSVAGLPRAAEPGLAELFPEPGLVSTATENKARYNVALASELGASLRRMTGVRDARVHLGLPESKHRRLDRAPKEPAKASVLLLIEPGETASLESRDDAIRELVAGAISGLEAGAVSVVVAEAQPFPEAVRQPAKVARPAMLATGMGALVAGLGLAGLLLVRRRYEGKETP